jgi:hypothetical protein
MIAPMKARSFVRCRFVTLVTIVMTASALSPRVRGADLTGSYVWNPVSIGAGGWVTGFVVHPLDPAVRYRRTDVGNAYRWDAAANDGRQCWLCGTTAVGFRRDW